MSENGDEPGATQVPQRSRDPFEAARAARLELIVERPHGGGLIVLGAFLFWLGIAVAGFAALLPDVADPGYPSLGRAPTYNTAKWPMIFGGSGLASGGVFLWALGRIIRAIFFLPGREVRQREIENAPPMRVNAPERESSDTAVAR